MSFDNERAKELLGQLRRRNDCFDLMVEFFDRAKADNNEAGMIGAFDAMALIHKGKHKLA